MEKIALVFLLASFIPYIVCAYVIIESWKKKDRGFEVLMYFGIGLALFITGTVLNIISLF